MRVVELCTIKNDSIHLGYHLPLKIGESVFYYCRKVLHVVHLRGIEGFGKESVVVVVEEQSVMCGVSVCNALLHLYLLQFHFNYRQR